MIFQIGWLVMGDDDEDDPNPGPKNADWHKVNIVKVEQIPGKGKKFVTVRTSDGTLDECTLTVRSITYERYHELRRLCDYGGPYQVLCNHGTLWMYIVDRNINHSENDKEAPLVERMENGQEYDLNVATWTIQLLEAND